jgi:hypothetical protein
MSQEQQLIDIIRRMVNQEIRNGARLQYQEGYVSDGSSYMVSAYMNGDETNLVDNIIPMAGFYVGAGDYIQVASNEAGWSWINRIKETSLYSKIAIDPNRGRVLIGDGNSPPTNAGVAGQSLKSGGSGGSIYWG